jgi:anti-anti-sigma regulatory factor
MLKITAITDGPSDVLLKLEGKLVQPWVEALAQVCAHWTDNTYAIRLDLSAVNFVDAAGTQLLREQIRQGIAIAACSRFVAELLHLENP